MKFGDVFKYNEIDYVYLVGVDEVTYAARILHIDQTPVLEKLSANVCKNGRDGYKLSQNRLYCFVKLTTEEVKDRIAHIGKAEAKDDKSFDVDSVGCSLNSSDLEDIKKEILDGPVDLKLKDGVRDIEIPKTEVAEVGSTD